MAYSKQEIIKKHPEYEHNSARWRFLLDSYLGGADYARGEYLTRYTYESNDDYVSRVSQTPLDNHCKSVVSIYNSFIFQKPPKRDFGDLRDDPLLQDFLDDADYDGRSWDSFMREVDTQASIFGHCWVVVDKPQVELTTRADEIANGVRPYVCMYSPLAVVDWAYERGVNGRYELTFLKVWSGGNCDSDEFLLYFTDRTELVRVDQNGSSATVLQITPNSLGYIPAVCVYSTRSHIKGIGISDISDIADTQRAIYDELSEIEQLIRISNHPSLVSTQEVQAAAGAGARIIIPENQDSGLKPYLLQPTSQSLDGIRNSIKDKVDSINQMANVSSVRATQGRSISGVAMATEFTLLNSHLTSKADNLELAEEQVFDIFFEWMGYPNAEFEIDYPESFNTRDRLADLTLLEKAKTVYALPSSGNPVLDSEINKAIVSIAIDDNEGQKEILDYIENQEAQQGIEEGFQQPMVDQPPASLAEAQAELNSEELINGCPIPIVDKQLNIDNHRICISEANLGPANPGAASTVFWMKKADLWNVPVSEAQTRLCSNCGYYMNTQQIKDCFTQGQVDGTLPLATDVDPTWTNTTDAAAYCLKWDITCTASRTCDTWAPGGPIVD